MAKIKNPNQGSLSKKKKNNQNMVLKKEDYKSLRIFYNSLKSLYKSKETMERLNLQSKVPDLLAEVIAVLKLHDKFRKSQIIWFGGRRKGYDITIDGKEIQVKNISYSGEWHMRNHAFEKYTVGENPKLIDVTKAMKELSSMYYRPHLFVDIANPSKPTFYCYSKERILKEIKSALKKHNEWVKKPRKKGTGQKNLWDPTLKINKKNKIEI